MLEFKKISKNFDSTRALNSVSFKIKRGEIIGLLGPNGAGKSTTLKILAGILPPSSGQVLINNQIFDYNHQYLKKMIGFLPENNPLYEEMTVEEFLIFWAKIKGLSQKQLKTALKFVLLYTGIKSVFYKMISELSKGYRQRVGLAQAILSKPEVLLLDEPTEGLDPNQRKEIKNLITKLGKDHTVILSSHVLSEVSQIAKRVIIINKGKIVADDKVSNLKLLKSGHRVIETELIGKNILTALKKLPHLIKIKKIKNDYYQIESEKGSDLRPKVFNLAKKNNWQLLTLKEIEQKLEDVFSQLTHE